MPEDRNRRQHGGKEFCITIAAVNNSCSRENVNMFRIWLSVCLASPRVANYKLEISLSLGSKGSRGGEKGKEEKSGRKRDRRARIAWAVDRCAGK